MHFNIDLDMFIWLYRNHINRRHHFCWQLTVGTNFKPGARVQDLIVYPELNFSGIVRFVLEWRVKLAHSCLLSSHFSVFLHCHIT